ncbi:unnamed protein product [Chrysoparadoxa australica]
MNPRSVRERLDELDHLINEMEDAYCTQILFNRALEECSSSGSTGLHDLCRLGDQVAAKLNALQERGVVDAILRLLGSVTTVKSLGDVISTEYFRKVPRAVLGCVSFNHIRASPYVTQAIQSMVDLERLANSLPTESADDPTELTRRGCTGWMAGQLLEMLSTRARHGAHKAVVLPGLDGLLQRHGYGPYEVQQRLERELLEQTELACERAAEGRASPSPLATVLFVLSASTLPDSDAHRALLAKLAYCCSTAPVHTYFPVLHLDMWCAKVSQVMAFAIAHPEARGTTLLAEQLGVLTSEHTLVSTYLVNPQLHIALCTMLEDRMKASTDGKGVAALAHLLFMITGRVTGEEVQTSRDLPSMWWSYPHFQTLPVLTAALQRARVHTLQGSDECRGALVAEVWEALKKEADQLGEVTRQLQPQAPCRSAQRAWMCMLRRKDWLYLALQCAMDRPPCVASCGGDAQLHLQASLELCAWMAAPTCKEERGLMLESLEYVLILLRGVSSPSGVGPALKALNQGKGNQYWRLHKHLIVTTWLFTCGHARAGWDTVAGTCRGAALTRLLAALDELLLIQSGALQHTSFLASLYSWLRPAEESCPGAFG